MKATDGNLKKIIEEVTITLTGTRFYTAMHAVSTPFTATAIRFVELIALKAYST